MYIVDTLATINAKLLLIYRHTEIHIKASSTCLDRSMKIKCVYVISKSLCQTEEIIKRFRIFVAERSSHLSKIELSPSTLCYSTAAWSVVNDRHAVVVVQTHRHVKFTPVAVSFSIARADWGIYIWARRVTMTFSRVRIARFSSRTSYLVTSVVSVFASS
jgi:hypothetical protein